MSQARRGERVGNPRRVYPIPLRLRNPFVPRELGGSEGYRGPGWATIRKLVLARDRFRSTISGLDAEQGKGLLVDHIHPFRFGGRNRINNLRTVDQRNNWAADLAFGSREKKPRRNTRW